MPGLIEALVDVAVIHGNEVNIAEDKTVIVILLHGLLVTNVEEFGTVERHITILPIRREENLNKRSVEDTPLQILLAKFFIFYIQVSNI